jgi:hypothetical protein
MTAMAKHIHIHLGARRAKDAADPVGKFARFKLPHASGTPMSAAGRIVRVLPDGRLEIKLQQGGYVTKRMDEVEVRDGRNDAFRLEVGKKYRSNKGIVTYLGPDTEGRHGDILVKNASGFTLRLPQGGIYGAWAPGSKDAAAFPSSLSWQGKTWYRTGKNGKAFSTGEESAEYRTLNDEERMWMTASGKKTVDAADSGSRRELVQDVRSPEVIEAELDRTSEEIEVLEDKGVTPPPAKLAERRRLQEELKAAKTPA